MNSTVLKSQFSNVYQNFFNKYDLVVSSPIIFPIVGDTSVYSQGSGFSLTQKIPLRNYVGVNFSNINNNQIEYIYKSDFADEFITGMVENFYPINNKLINNIGINYSIGILSEYSWNDYFPLISNLLIIVLLIQNKITLEEISLLNIENKNYKKVLNKILALDKNLICKSNFFSQIRNNSSFVGSCVLNSNTQLLNMEENKKMNYQNIGSNLNFSNLDLTISIINPNILLKTDYKPVLIMEEEAKLKSFLHNYGLHFTDMCLLKGIEHFSMFYSLKIFQYLKYLYINNPLGNQLFHELYAYRKTLKSVFKSTNSSSIDIRQIKNLIKKQITSSDFNIYIDQFGLYGNARLLFLTNKLDYINQKLLNSINEQTGYNLTLDYSSYFDGFESDGIRIEQYTSQGMFSNYCSKYLITSVNQNGKFYQTGDYEIISQVKNSCLVLDTINQKILINGIKLTSKDIHSQKTTIETLEHLIENYDQDISNKDLPISSYSKNKNEMIGKIIIPISKLIEKNTGLKFPLRCTGSNNNFYLKLIKSDIDICLIKKLF